MPGVKKECNAMDELVKDTLACGIVPIWPSDVTATGSATVTARLVVDRTRKSPSEKGKRRSAERQARQYSSQW
jgi:hypothetical protein